MKPKHQRLIFVGASALFICLAVVLFLQALRENVVFFYTPSELAERPEGRIRVGGLVEEGSVRRGEGARVAFRVTDGKAALAVTFDGMLPGLFREGQGVVAEGRFEGEDFHAERVLTKHDEYYMPKEVVEALKKSGQWRGGK